MTTRALLLTLATTLTLNAPVLAGWEEIKAKARELGEKASEVGQEAWASTTEVSQEAWSATKEWSQETWEASSAWADAALNSAGEWSDEALGKGKTWYHQGEVKLEEMVEPKSPQQARDALNTLSEVTLIKLLTEHPEVKPLFDDAYGYAVFDSRQFSLLLHTNGGSGVAVNRHSGRRTYMNMLGGGLALGFGAKFYQQVMLFEDGVSYDKFINDGWSGGTEAGILAWNESAKFGQSFHNGVAFYVLNEKGLLLDANINGSRYWQDGDLN
ncbi:hypothetical protein FCL40_08695 [Ferrimonas sediminicola]|uniref:Lipoprotein n=1 Tax=Ferrimonas sediminicola TaxID=2569538 RepID=A0A4U1BG46_9GAMM|nr:hypothetical protein [Ferrimonas sediminicola]TKB49400.1 hypothetical protein FCL40_08695 [Ferrimonas sediminicola]